MDKAAITEKLKEKWHESLNAVLPIIVIVMGLCFVIAPVSPSILLCFLMGAVLLLVRMMFFSLGAEIAMTPMGERVGTCLTKSRKLRLTVGAAFLLGFIITISEPDLQVLAGQVPAIPNTVLILTVACGVGLFLVIAVLRMLISIPLTPILIILYISVFVLAYFTPSDFLSVAFDAGGVTTGPMTAAFLLPLAQGACTALGGNIVQDAFGVVAMVAMTPLITIQVMGIIAEFRTKHENSENEEPAAAWYDLYDDDSIIKL